MCEVLAFRGLRVKLPKEVVHSGGVDPDQMSKPTHIWEMPTRATWGEAMEEPMRQNEPPGKQNSNQMQEVPGSRKPHSKTRSFPHGTVLPSAGRGGQAPC